MPWPCRFAAWLVSMGWKSAVSDPGHLMLTWWFSASTGKEVRFGVDGRSQMLLGVDKLADAVQVRRIKRTYDRASSKGV